MTHPDCPHLTQRYQGDQEPAQGIVYTRRCTDCADQLDPTALLFLDGDERQQGVPLAWSTIPPLTLVYAHSDGRTAGYVDRGGFPDDPRERCLLRAVLAHTLDLLDQADRAPGATPS